MGDTDRCTAHLDWLQSLHTWFAEYEARLNPFGERRMVAVADRAGCPEARPIVDAAREAYGSDLPACTRVELCGDAATVFLGDVSGDEPREYQLRIEENEVGAKFCIRNRLSHEGDPKKRWCGKLFMLPIVMSEEALARAVDRIRNTRSVAVCRLMTEE